MYHHGWRQPNFFKGWIRQTKEEVRIYVVIGESDNHLGLLEAMHEEKLFEESSEEGQTYFVVGVRPDHAWDRRGNFLPLFDTFLRPTFLLSDSARYLRGFLAEERRKVTEGVLQGDDRRRKSDSKWSELEL